MASPVEAPQEGVTQMHGVSLNSNGPQPLRLVAAPDYIRVETVPRDRRDSGSPDSQTGPSPGRSGSAPLPPVPIPGYPSQCSDRPILRQVACLPGPAGTTDGGRRSSPDAAISAPGSVPPPEPSPLGVPLTSPTEAAHVRLATAVQVSANGVHVSEASITHPSVETLHKIAQNDVLRAGREVQTKGGLPPPTTLPPALADNGIAISNGSFPSGRATGSSANRTEADPSTQANGSVAISKEGVPSAETTDGVTTDKEGDASAQANGGVTANNGSVLPAEANGGITALNGSVPPAEANGGLAISEQPHLPNSQADATAPGVVQPQPTEEDDVVVVEVVTSRAQKHRARQKAKLRRQGGVIVAAGNPPVGTGKSVGTGKPVKPRKLLKKNVQLPPPVLSRNSVGLPTGEQERTPGGAGDFAPAGTARASATSAPPPESGVPVSMPPPLLVPNASSLQPAPTMLAVPTVLPSDPITEPSANSRVAELPSATGPDVPAPATEQPMGPSQVPVTPVSASVSPSSQAPAASQAGATAGPSLFTPPLRPERHPNLLTCKLEDHFGAAGGSSAPNGASAPNGGPLVPAHAGSPARPIGKKAAKLFKAGDCAVAHCTDNQVDT